MTQRILAVAIGDPLNSRTITSTTSLTGVRPYIIGLTTYLSQQTVPNSHPQRNYTLGTDYTIDYQECFEDDETFTGTPDVIFCMSTPVTRKAKNFTSTIPIVGIFSEQAVEKFDQTTNICGLNAQRIQNARNYYDKFHATVPGLASIYVLHRVANTASTKSLSGIHAGGPLPVPLLRLQVATQPRHDIRTLISAVPHGSGLLVLPVDLFFGSANDINSQATAQSLPVFWPVKDWVPPAIGGFGVPQEKCGELMGKQVQFILENPGQIPQGQDDRFVTVQPTDYKWVASKAVANALNIKLGEHRDLHFV
jgi:ABC-type uncharacterized transport system substrate-binding protein